MSHSQSDYTQPKELEAYFKRKAEQEAKQQEQQKAQQLSAYEACVLKESARVKDLITQAQAKDNRSDANK